MNISQLSDQELIRTINEIFVNRNFEDEETIKELFDESLARHEYSPFMPFLELANLQNLFTEEILEFLLEAAINLGHPKKQVLGRILQCQNTIEQVFLPKEWSEQYIQLYMSLFKGRTDYFAKQFISEGRSGYYPQKYRMNSKAVRRLLNGDESYGIYLLDDNDHVHLFVLDFDIAKTVLETGYTSKEELIKELWPYVKKAADFLQSEFGFSVLVEFSGGKGYHIWCFFEEAIPAKLVRKWFQYQLEPHILPGSAFRLEFFPKQDKIKKGGLGNLVKLPFGKHLLTSKWSNAVNHDGTFIENHEEVLKNIARIRRSHFLEICNSFQESREPEVSVDLESEKEEPLPVKFVKSPPKFQSTEPTTKFLSLISGCDTLRNLVSRIRTHGIVSKQEEHVLIYVLAHLKEEGALEIHRILSRTMGYDADQVNLKIRAVPPHHISCPKIRQRIREISSISSCNCSFQLQEGSYPSPLIHAGITTGTPSRELTPPKPSALAWNENNQISTTRIAEEIRQIDNKLSSLQERKNLLMTCLERICKPGEKIDTPCGIFEFNRLQDGKGTLTYTGENS